MGHFTYLPTIDSLVLKQGDILDKIGIQDIVKNVHPYFQKEDYKYFIVLTQSCDLVRRSGQSCSAPYITMAAVRPFEKLFYRYLSRFQHSKIEKKGKVCDNKSKVRVAQFVERLLNNNEEEYFYLEKDLDLGLQEPQVAFLRLSIALKSDLHYDTCRMAKKAELNDLFAAKLGWLVGKMYSRIGTPDWVPDMCSKEEFERKCSDIITSSVLWTEQSAIKELRKHEERIEVLSEEEIRKIAYNFPKKNKREMAEKEIERIICESECVIAGHEKKLLRRIMHDETLSSIAWK